MIQLFSFSECTKYRGTMVLVWVAALFMHLAMAGHALAEIPQNVRDVFESMLDNLEPDVRDCFRKSLDKDTAVVEMTPSQFRSFRESPFNPFEGLEHIDASDGAGNIALQFALPSVRNRPKAKFEKQHPALRKQLKGLTRSAGPSTVRVFAGSRQVAMGTVVGANGLVVTKASEVKSHEKIVCRSADGRSVDAKILRIDETNDVALLKLAESNLTPVNWNVRQPELGEFLLTPDEKGNVLAVGNYSTTPRSTILGEQAFLGVKPETVPQGVRVSDIRPGSASHEAGLKNGDIITKLAGATTRDVSDLVFQIRKHRPGDKVSIEYLRSGFASKTSATLAGNHLNGERAARFKMMNRLGAVPSRRNSGFPVVFQHDTPIFPEQCGGPIVDLDGNVVGINIARNGRAATYALPSGQVQAILAEFQRENVALRQE